MALEDYKMTKVCFVYASLCVATFGAVCLTPLQEQLIAIDEENAGLRTERAELHSLLNDTAQELDQKKQELADAEGEAAACFRMHAVWLWVSYRSRRNA